MKHIYLFIVTGFLLTGCGKEFLDIKREAHQVVPKELKDYQGLLDRISTINVTSTLLNVTGAGEFITNDGMINALSPTLEWAKRAYTWQKDIFMENEISSDWEGSFERILYANMAMEVTKTDASQAEKDEVIGQALFHRAWNYYHLVTTFCDVYRPEQNETKLGLPLRTEYDITARPQRSNLEETYRFIEEDLLKAEKLINNKSITIYRADVSAVRALLAKVYLEKEDYEKVLKYALLYLKERGSLFDYNELPFPLPRFSFSSFYYGEGNPEVVLHYMGNTNAMIAYSRHDLKNTLFHLYEESDIRKDAFFFQETDGRVTFRGSYFGDLSFFTGIATDEMYLLVAECYARKNDKTNAAKYLNDLLINRYKKGAFEPLDFGNWNEEKILKRIILERQKELVMRGTRWVDLKRYNKEERFQATLKRTMLGQDYILAPNDPRWVWPLPPNEVLHGNLIQNER